MIELLGKEFSKETIDAKKMLDEMGVEYKFIDIDFDEDAFNWIKMNKIMGLPVIKNGKLFVVGEKDLDSLLKNMFSNSNDC